MILALICVLFHFKLYFSKNISLGSVVGEDYVGVNSFLLKLLLFLLEEPLHPGIVHDVDGLDDPVPLLIIQHTVEMTLKGPVLALLRIFFIERPGWLHVELGGCAGQWGVVLSPAQLTGSLSTGTDNDPRLRDDDSISVTDRTKILRNGKSWFI